MSKIIIQSFNIIPYAESFMAVCIIRPHSFIIICCTKAAKIIHISYVALEIAKRFKKTLICLNSHGFHNREKWMVLSNTLIGSAKTN